MVDTHTSILSFNNGNVGGPLSLLAWLFVLVVNSTGSQEYEQRQQATLHVQHRVEYTENKRAMRQDQMHAYHPGLSTHMQGPGFLTLDAISVQRLLYVLRLPASLQ